MESIAENLWKLAYNLRSDEPMEQKRRAAKDVWRAADWGDYPD